MMNENLPPQSLDVEEAILGAMMLERDSVAEVMSILQDDDFYSDKHKMVYRAIKELFAESDPVDIKTVVSKLRSIGTLDKVGGPLFITGLTSKINSSMNIEYHSRIVKQDSIRRSIIKTGYDLAKSGFDSTQDVFDILEKASKAIINVGSGMTKKYVNLKDIMLGLIEEIEENKKKKKEDKPIGSYTGLQELDRITGGFQNGELIVVAARPGMGKTGFVNTCLRNMSVDFNSPVGFLSLEMTTKATGFRELSMESGISMQKMQTGNIEDYEIKSLVGAANRLSKGNIYVDDTAGLNPYEIRSKATLMKMKHDIGALFFDYIQLGEDKTARTTEEKVSGITSVLKQIAKDLDIPVIALSQLSREVEKRPNKTPMLSDLRSSGSIEQDADMVMFLYRPEYYGITKSGDTDLTGLGQIIIAKYRNGKTGSAWFRFIGKLTKWTDLNYVESQQENKEMPF